VQDLLFKFKFKVLLFKKGVISILHGLGNGNKWGCCGKLNWKEMENAGSLGNIFIFEEPQKDEKYDIFPPRHVD